MPQALIQFDFMFNTGCVARGQVPSRPRAIHLFTFNSRHFVNVVCRYVTCML
jgi:hypothetical protein